MLRVTTDFTDNALWVPDQALWLEENKRNLDARKAEWKKIQPNLKALAKYELDCNGYLAMHKSLFFKGELPEKFLVEINAQRNGNYGCGEVEFFYAFPLFYFWYHPQLTDDVLSAGFKRFTREPFFFTFTKFGETTPCINSAPAIVKSRKILTERQNAKGFFDSYGFMGGKEALIGPYFLFGSKSGFESESYRRGWFDEFSTRDILGSMGLGMNVLRGQGKHPKLGIGYPTNPKGFGQYIWPQISHYVQENTLEYITNPEKHGTQTKVKGVRIFIQRLLYFEENTDTNETDPLAIECQQRIMNQYRNGEFADWLNEMFIEQENLGFQGG